MITLDKALVESVRAGLIDLASAKEYVSDQNQFNTMVSR